jgi:hypothetical protein
MLPLPIPPPENTWIHGELLDADQEQFPASDTVMVAKPPAH